MATSMCTNCNGTGRKTHFENGVTRFECCSSCKGSGAVRRNETTHTMSDPMKVVVGLGSLAMGFYFAYSQTIESKAQQLGLAVMIALVAWWVMTRKELLGLVRWMLAIGVIYAMYEFWKGI